jgi:flagellar protein FlaI
MEKEPIDKYKVVSDGISLEVTIHKRPEKFAPVYDIRVPKLEEATRALLEDTRDKIVTAVPIKVELLRDPASLATLRGRIKEVAHGIIAKEIPGTPENVLNYAVVVLANDMLGLGNIEFLLDDENLEEIVINNSKSAVWVYHKKHGWLVTNMVIPSEDQVENYASIVGRRVGRQINILNPLMDAHLLTGDRVNATLFPISTFGNTLTIRKFRREPWTVTDLLENGTLNTEVASFFWLCMQYELSMIISGGTASGKTTLLNVLMPFIPPNERIISLEDTRELNLPEFLHWVPMTTREANIEGRGEVKLLDLLVNSLRMRPDRIVVGEIRRQPEAEVLFEALNTGHSVYSTLHANTSDEAFRRLTSPPINLPEDLVLSMPLLAIMFRHRKLRIRRVFEVSELIGAKEAGKIEVHDMYKWEARADKISKASDSIRTFSELNIFTGMNFDEIRSDMKEKEGILKWLVKNKVNTVNTVGKVVSEYYSNTDEFLKTMGKKQDVEKILGKFISELKK